mmetsp:Transcript_649/g.1189  ORF Transcript_649/g.1189 Transcript_649/m.1189 type:complete len:89 (+) Transcript_649:200-466(+)
MRFLNHATFMTYVIKPHLLSFIILRMVKISICHGICNISAFAFAAYAALMINCPPFDIDGGQRLGRVAIEMMGKLGADEVCSNCFIAL